MEMSFLAVIPASGILSSEAPGVKLRKPVSMR
jgi:hypothetical protein